MSQLDLKHQILTAIPIESYIGRYVVLKKQGKYLKGLCPFHGEKTPSFTVTPEKGIYHCFGCGRGGDLFNFVMEMEGGDFNHALELLSSIAGVKRQEKSGKNKKQNDLYRVNEKAASIFTEFLNSSEAKVHQNYLADRKISQESIKTFRIGASPDRWNFLTEILESDKDSALELGLIRKGTSGTYDFFRNRIIFPIADASGQIIAFGGRALPGKDDTAKYINSPESPVFHKGASLYGLFHSITAMRQERFLYLAEGYLDVIGLHQAGIRNVSAPLGTAFTEDHTRLIKRFTDAVVLLFDGDEAGRKAALRASSIINEQGGLTASIVMLPEGMDAFDISVNLSGDRLRKILSFTIPSTRFLIIEILFPGQMKALFREKEHPEDTVKMVYDLYVGHPVSSIKPDADEKRRALDRMFQYLITLKDEITRSLFLDESASLLGLENKSVRDEWKKKNDEKRPPERNGIKPGIPSKRAGENRQNQLFQCEKQIVLEFLISPNLIGEYERKMSDFPFLDDHAEMLWRYLESRYSMGNIWVLDDFVRFDLPGETISYFSGEVLQLAGENEEDLKHKNRKDVISQLMHKHEELTLKKKLKALENELLVADAVEQDVLINQYNTLLIQLKGLEFLNRKQPGSE